MRDISKSLMTKVLGVGGVMLTCSFVACLTAPNEPNSAEASCPSDLSLWNGVCRQSCRQTADCAGGLQCMFVGAGTALCLDYSSCAYLRSDTHCEKGTHGVGYTSYGSGGAYDAYQEDPYWMVSPDYSGELYSSYQGATCIGDATWVTAPLSGDPVCGQTHAVERCRPTASGCALLAGTTQDIAEP